MLMKDMGKRQTVKLLFHEGLTETEVAQRLGLSRERIRQLAGESLKSLLAPPEGYITFNQAAEKLGYTANGVKYLVSKGHLEAVKLRARWYVRLPLLAKSCVICGEPLPKHRASYCSDKCSTLGEEKLQRNAAWRRLYNRRGEKLVPSIDYVRPREQKE